MAKIHDANALSVYQFVLVKLAHVTGYIEWRRVAREWLDKELAGLTQCEVNQLMAEHVQNGGEIHQVEERRPEYTQWRFHYDLRMPISGRRIYIETVLQHESDDPEDCVIVVVNMHDV